MTYQLDIVAADGVKFSGQVTRVMVRTSVGDVAILPRHINYVTTVAMGEAKIYLEDGTIRNAACIGGMLAVTDGAVKLVPTTFEWSEDIDMERVKQSMDKANDVLAQRADQSDVDIAMAEARLKRALVRQIVGK
ncbi:MAG: ATP synthase F1 subunit epsilon [Eubacteriales bacterium]